MLEVIRRLDWVTEFGFKAHNELEVQIPAERSGELNGLLNRAGFNVEEFAWIRPDLEEFFLQLTGGGNSARITAG